MVGRNLSIRGSVRAGFLVAAGTLGGATVYSSAQPTAEPGRAIRYLDLPASRLHAGSTGGEVKRVLGEPTTTTELGPPGSGDIALAFAREPVPTRVTLTANRVTSVALGVVYIDPAPLPMRARSIKATMVRNGVAGFLGAPTGDARWTKAGRDFERMTFASAGEPEFSVFLVDGLVIDVRLGHDKPAGLGTLVLPVAAADSELAIGQSPAQAVSFLGPMETTIHFALAGQSVEYATYHERDGDGFVTVTFIAGLVTAFRIWPSDAW
jgi:hypothetical protein